MDMVISVLVRLFSTRVHVTVNGRDGFAEPFVADTNIDICVPIGVNWADIAAIDDVLPLAVCWATMDDTVD